MSDANGFTLVELLVVVSIIALLLGILLPALGKARSVARTTACMANLRSVGTAMTGYSAEFNSYPPAYLYLDSSGNVRREDQTLGGSHDGGYRHWSWFLFTNGSAKENAFKCPTMTRGGLPRTNPGPIPENAQNWEENQIDQTSSGPAANSIEDQQAPRMAYTVNSLVVPRNKFIPPGGNLNAPVNIEVPASRIARSSTTILATEFFDNWKVMAIGKSEAKSHRPIFPVFGISTGYRPYTADFFRYASSATSANYDRSDANVAMNGSVYGIESMSEMLNSNVGPDTVKLDDLEGGPNVNAIGRHHPGGDSFDGGRANFVFVDGHVETLTIRETMVNRLWGEKLYAFKGHKTLAGKEITDY